MAPCTYALRQVPLHLLPQGMTSISPPVNWDWLVTCFAQQSTVGSDRSPFFICFLTSKTQLLLNISEIQIMSGKLDFSFGLFTIMVLTEEFLKFGKSKLFSRKMSVAI